MYGSCEGCTRGVVALSVLGLANIRNLMCSESSCCASCDDAINIMMCSAGSHSVALREPTRLLMPTTLQDGSESGHTLSGNLGMLTRESYALPGSDTTPATFLLANPNNTITNNVAAGSAGVGFWLRFPDGVEGRFGAAVTCRYCG